MVFDKQILCELEEKAKELRRNIIFSVGVGPTGHIGGSFSSADVVAALYFHKMKHSPTNRYMADRDRFVLSKGHVAILQYAALAQAGYFPIEELKNTKTLDSILQGHPDLVKTGHLGIEAGTGSLGQGLSIGVGMALGLRMDKIDANVYVLIGDGELAEGQVWEAAMAGSVFGLDKLVAIVDKNNKQAQGAVADRFNIKNIVEKWTSFGWHVIEIDGHDIEQILGALYAADEVHDKPTVIIANTVKGKGLAIAEEHPAGFHNAALTQEQYDEAMILFAGGER